MNLPVNPNDCFCDDAAEGAALGLFGLMSGISEGFYAASWLIGLEHALWNAVQGGARRFGLGELTERQCTLLKLLSEEADGWWVWDEAKGPLFLSLDVWRERAA